jgi:O-methyltransferase
MLRKTLKRQVTSLFWPNYSPKIDRINRLPLFLDFMEKSNPEKILKSKYELHAWMSNYVNKLTSIAYLEFGVASGKSMKIWVSENKNPESNFLGFDSFEGLPEDWQEGFPKGTFSSNGTPPNITDPRLEFVIGWFQNTLPDKIKSINRQKKIIIHHDADLYSSTMYCLVQSNDLLKVGDVVIFDDFANLLHVNRAFHDYLNSFQRNFRLICSTPELTTVAFEVV